MVADLQVQWGSVAEWVAAVGAASALLIALFTLRLEVQGRREAAGRLADEETRQRFAQARQITFEVSTKVHPARFEGGVMTSPPWYCAANATVHNYSDAPIYNVEVHVRVLGGAEAVDAWALIEPGSEVRLLARGPDMESTDHPPVVKRLTFVDADGRFWESHGPGSVAPLGLGDL